MTDPKFTAQIRPEMHGLAAEAIRAYEGTYGSTGPGCCPEALAAVLSLVAAYEGIDLFHWIVLLRGEKS